MTGERAHICEHGPRQGAEVLVEMDGRAGAPWGTGDVSGSRDMTGILDSAGGGTGCAI